MTFDLIVIFASQALPGCVYQQIGMAGLSLRGWRMARWLRTEPGDLALVATTSTRQRSAPTV
jgi:hypothetical protein